LVQRFPKPLNPDGGSAFCARMDECKVGAKLNNLATKYLFNTVIPAFAKYFANTGKYKISDLDRGYNLTHQLHNEGVGDEKFK